MKYIYDNSNINESYSGIVLPATYSFARRVYEKVYKEFCAVVGVGKNEIAKNSSVFGNMVVLIGGRIYYDLSNWHKMITLLPGYKYNSKFMEEMMGVAKKHRGRIAIRSRSEKYRDLIKAVYISFRIIVLFLTMKNRIKKFNKTFDLKYLRIKKEMDKAFSGKTDLKKLTKMYVNWEDELTKDFKTPIVNDFAVMIGTGLVRKSLGEMEAGKYISGLPGIKSAEPGMMLSEIISKASTNKKFLKSNEYKKMLKNYIKKYGFRTPGELKLESLSFHDNPLFLERLIRNNLSMPNLGGKQKTQAKKHRLNLPQKFLVNWVMASISDREETRLKRAMAFSIVRDFLLRVGRQLAADKLLKNQKDIYYLTIEDIENKNPGNFKKNVQKNKNKYALYKDLALPRRIESSLPNINLKKYTKSKKAKSTKKVIKGLVVSSGKDKTSVVTAQALVLESFDSTADFRSKILVVSQTDPGWTIVFPLLAGLVVERGGMLSHASIVSREMGIPCIVGASEAVLTFKSGELIQMDLLKGVVTKQ